MQQQQQQQHLMQMQPMMAACASPNSVTTDLIQQYLDENKQLILAILDNQSSGKVDECAENQAKLQRNLMYLAAIADSQPQMPMTAQFPLDAVMQSAPRYIQRQHTTPQYLTAARSPMFYAQSPLSAMHQALHGPLGSSTGGNNGLDMPRPGETAMGSSVGGMAGGVGVVDFGGSVGGGKQNARGAGPREGLGGSKGGQSDGDGTESVHRAPESLRTGSKP